MLAARIIRADGVEWPLATFIDAYGLKLHDRFDPPPFSSGPASAARVTVVTATGELIADRTADAILWADVIAFAPVAGTPAATLCKVCDEPVFEAGFEDNPDICAKCEAWGGDAW
ncbi:MAG TPA: hypothetical protein VF695_06575 [Sphingomonas sp.]|jgi:hypothetical protein